MKILLVGNYYYPEHIGGIEIVTNNLIKYYRFNRHEVVWLAANVPPRFRDSSTNDTPIRSWNITEEKLGFPQPLPWPGELLKLYRSVRWADVVHLHDCLYIINILAFMISKSLKKPVLVTQHTEIIPYPSLWKNWLQAFALRTIGVFLHAHSDRSVFISTNTRDHLTFITKHLVDPVVIPNGIDTEFFQPFAPDVREQMRRDVCGDAEKPILLFVGRFVKIKGIQLLIPIIERHPEWHWLLVGRPDEYDPSTWNYKNVTFRPSLGMDGLRIAYGCADLTVHPSTVVGMSLTISESMACGTPVLLSRDVLYDIPKDDMENFILVDLETDKIEKKIFALLADRENLTLYSRKARIYAEKSSSWREIANRYISILEELAQREGNS